MFDGIFEAIHREMDALEEKYEKGTQLSNQDLAHIDTMAHALKSLKAYEAMTSSSHAREYSRERYDRDGSVRESSYRRY